MRVFGEALVCGCLLLLDGEVKDGGRAFVEQVIISLGTLLVFLCVGCSDAGVVFRGASLLSKMRRVSQRKYVQLADSDVAPFDEADGAYHTTHASAGVRADYAASGDSTDGFESEDDSDALLSQAADFEAEAKHFRNSVSAIEVANDGEVQDPVHSACFRCELLPPVRARHCRDCDTCVAVFDHHCSFLGNCIGWKNRRWFMLLLVVELMHGLLLLSLCMRNYDRLGSHKRDGEATSQIFARQMLRSLLMMVVFSKTAFVAILFVMHTVLISIQSTTNELVTTWRYGASYPISTLKHACARDSASFNRSALARVEHVFEEQKGWLRLREVLRRLRVFDPDLAGPYPVLRRVLRNWCDVLLARDVSLFLTASPRKSIKSASPYGKKRRRHSLRTPRAGSQQLLQEIEIDF
ncbi:MAG: hypothetical protein MHM6MM_001489 [Cercozoa sp. M6MM]